MLAWSVLELTGSVECSLMTRLGPAEKKESPRKYSKACIRATFFFFLNRLHDWLAAQHMEPNLELELITLRSRPEVRSESDV